MTESRVYRRSEIASFYKTDETFGLLSNMKGRIYLQVNEVSFYSSEALYQALKFPYSPEIQKKIAGVKSPLIAKRVAQSFRDKSRGDWENVRNNIMRLVLRIKYVQWPPFRDILFQTGDKAIVEVSRKDTYWGAIEINEETIEGRNILGRLLMELREDAKCERVFDRASHILSSTRDLLLDGKPIALTIADREGRNSPNI